YNREDRIRTCDPLVPNQVLYHTKPLPEVCTLKDLNLQPSDSSSDTLSSCAKGASLYAEDRNRTGTVVTNRGILSPGRLPVPPPRHDNDKRKTGFEPATPTMARWCSTTELLPHFY